MTKKGNNDKLKKLKIAGLTALVAGGVAASVVLTKQSANQTETETNTVVQEEVLSIPEMEKRIVEMNNYLEKLQHKIDSKDTDPETRFYARQAYAETEERLADMQRRLENAKKKQESVIDFYDAKKVR